MTGYTAVVVGNPKPRSRTLQAACLLAQALTGPIDPAYVLDVVELGAALLRPGDPRVVEAVDRVAGASLLIAASPTYKATYTGLLKAYFDRFGSNALAGVVAVPLMLGGAPVHTLAVDTHLHPLLLELGASCPTRGLFVLESELEQLDAVVAAWLAANETILRRLVRP
jgi:FMN reductase